MSLVAYASSEESSEDEENNCGEGRTSKASDETMLEPTHKKLSLPTPKHDSVKIKEEEEIGGTNFPEKIHFENLPQPKGGNCQTRIEESIIEEEDDIPPRKETSLQFEKSVKKDRAPVKITVPSLSEFKDVEEENTQKRNKIVPTSKGTKLFALLPPPKGAEIKSANTLIPRVLNKTPGGVSTSEKVLAIKNVIHTEKSVLNKVNQPMASKKTTSLLNYDSNSEDEEVNDSSSHSTTDFFALTAKPDSFAVVPEQSDLGSTIGTSFDTNNTEYDYLNVNSNSSTSSTPKTLTSNVMNLPKEEILLKNKAEVGPKLPVPEQEYNLDIEGNVAFDEKAVEYLCGKRGVKRKNKEIDGANIIEINGEDIKPDEREWLVKALTEEPVERPISMSGGGVNSQSKKKHQITYLAHQAKAMEAQLKNQWSQNKMTRKQTQSKYGF